MQLLYLQLFRLVFFFLFGSEHAAGRPDSGIARARVDGCDRDRDLVRARCPLRGSIVPRIGWLTIVRLHVHLQSNGPAAVGANRAEPMPFRELTQIEGQPFPVRLNGSM